MAKVLELKNVGKRFLAPDSWAVRNIDMQISQGEITGIIGRNGAGKSTLLKIMAGIFPPTEGEMKIKGKIASLFSLGAGFQDELSGKENIYLNANILGMRNEEINRKYQDIVNFSELNDFIGLPLGSYSDGMRMRLGFSVAVHTDFDILLIDEALLVGDISFQKKCFQALSAYKRRGKTMVLVTQSLGVIEQLCDQAFLLEEGRLIFSGLPEEAIERYRKLLNEKEFLQRKSRNLVTATKRWAGDMSQWGQREGTDAVIIKSVQIADKWGRKTNRFQSREKMRIKIIFEAYRTLKDVHFGLALFREDGVYCYGPNSRWDGYKIDLFPGMGQVIFEYKHLLLAAGTYYLTIAIWEKEEAFAYEYHRAYYKIEIAGRNLNNQLLSLPSKWRPFSWQRLFFQQNSVAIDELQHKEPETKEKDGLKVTKVEFLDQQNRAGQQFFTARQMKIRIIFKLSKEKFYKKDLKLWIGVFRSDGIYCQGLTQKIGPKNKEAILTFPHLVLLPGGYQVSVGFWDTGKEQFLTYHHRKYFFKVLFTRPDHGTVYLPHRWQWQLPLNSKNEKNEK